MPTPRATLPLRAATLALALAAAAGACNPGGPSAPAATTVGQAPTRSPTPTPTSSADAAPTVAPSPTPPVPLPSGALRLPTAFAIELAPGTYFSTPPFDLPFTFEIRERGWRAGHLNGEFFDIQRFDGVPTTGLPSRILGFAHPWAIEGVTRLHAADLTPEEAIAALAARDDLVTANVTDFELFGRAAVRVDIHAPVDNTPLFGGADGTFGQSVDHDARLAAVPIDGGLLVVLIEAKPDDLEAAWAQAAEILETVYLY
jgi:hypothetical protein